MREMIYDFGNGYDYTKKIYFKEDTHLSLVVKPHEYSVSIDGELIRSTSCKGFRFQVSNKGEVMVFDNEGSLLATTPEQDRIFEEIQLHWEQDLTTLSFGYTYEEDTYPHCDGEHDRWIISWRTLHKVVFHENAKELEIAES